MNTAFRAAFVGTCQVTGMMHTARLLCPDAEFEAYHVNTTFNAAEIAERVAGMDLVVTQFDETDPSMTPISPNSLAGRVGKAVFMPVFGFTGLQPDSTYIINSDGVLAGAVGETHSLITVAGYLLGLPQERVERLFNAHIFAELGYFDAYEASVQIMSETFARAGYHMSGRPERWLKNGTFMYTINHPAISVLKEMALEALKRAEFVSADTQPPAEVHDALARSAVVPVFKPLAKRIGMAGSNTFLKTLIQEDDSRDFELREFIDRSYEIYDGLTTDKLFFGRVEEVRAKLEALLS